MKQAIIVLCAALGACSTEPVAYHPGTEIPPGPGLLTGPRGEFVLSAEEWRRYQEWKQREAATPKQ